jgi:hypothetical protein
MGVHDSEDMIHGRWAIGEVAAGPFALAPMRGWIDSGAVIETVQRAAEPEGSWALLL